MIRWFQINSIYTCTSPWGVIHTPESDSGPVGGFGNASAQSASWESSWTWCGFYSRISLPVRIPLSFLFRISANVPVAACLPLLLWRKFIRLFTCTLFRLISKFRRKTCTNMSYLKKISTMSFNLIAPPKNVKPCRLLFVTSLQIQQFTSHCKNNL